MSGLGRAMAQALRNEATMRSAQTEFDNRAEPDVSALDAIRWAIVDAQETLGRAERAAECGDIDAAVDLLHSAGTDLCDVEAP